MGKVSIYLHKSVQDYADFLATLFDTSRSEVIEKMIRHVNENDLENEIWEDYEDLIEAFDESAEESEEEEVEEVPEEEIEPAEEEEEAEE